VGYSAFFQGVAKGFFPGGGATVLKFDFANSIKDQSGTGYVHISINITKSQTEIQSHAMFFVQ